MRWAAASALALAALVAGCADDPPCGELGSCDIRKADCQQAAARMAACLRDEVPAEVEVEVEVVDFDRFLREQAEMADDVDADARRASERWFEGLSLLGLASGALSPGEATAVSYRNVAALYDVAEDRILILDRGGALDGRSYNLLLLHEMIHALQDRQLDLEALSEQRAWTFDGELGLAAMVEGEATLQTDRALMGAHGVREAAVDFELAYQVFRGQGLSRAIYSDEPFIDLRSSFIYPYGAAFVHAAWDVDDNAGIDALLEAPPVSSRQVMIGFGEQEPAGGPWLEDGLDGEALPVVDGASTVRFVHAGAFAVQVALERAGSTWLGSSPRRAIGRLRNDVLTVLVEEDDAPLLVWRLRFADDEEATAFADAAEARFGEAFGAQVQQLERDVVLLAAADAGRARELLEGGLDWEPLPEASSEADADAAAHVLCRAPVSAIR